MDGEDKIGLAYGELIERVLPPMAGCECAFVPQPPPNLASSDSRVEWAPVFSEKFPKRLTLLEGPEYSQDQSISRSLYAWMSTRGWPLTG